jgi:cobalt-zinc-cadmium efflux system membrane fusion protein
MHHLSGALLSLLLLTTPVVVLAHGGHGEHFQGGTEASQSSEAIKVDAQTAKRLGIKVEPVTRQRLAIGIKTTGQIEALPNQKVEVTTPIQEATVARLLVEPGALVSAGQAVAILYSPELAELRVASAEKRAEAEADVQEAQADLRLAQQNYERQRRLAAADLQQARTQSAFAQERYSKDRQLAVAGALPRRQAFESRAQLAEAKAAEARVASRGDVLEAAAQLKRAQSALSVSQSRVNLSDDSYQTRLEQLGTSANLDGTVTVKAPISGKVADREATPGESFEEAGESLMTILNDRRVWATANIYEKDLNKVKVGQEVRVQATSLPNRSFEGRITQIGAIVEADRAVPVKAELDNSSGLLKPGTFAELEILTDQAPTAVTAIPNSAIVETNDKKQIVFVQTGDSYQPVEVTLGQTSGDRVEVKRGLFDGDRVVTQGASLLYGQSLREGGKAESGAEAGPSETATERNGFQPPWWVVLPAGAAIAAGAFWAGRHTQRRRLQLGDARYELPVHEAEIYHRNSHLPSASHPTGLPEGHKGSRPPHRG